MMQAPGFEPAKKQVEPPQKGGRQYAGLRLANFARWRSDLGGRMNNVIRRGRFFIGKSYLGHLGGACVIMVMYKTKGVF